MLSCLKLICEKNNIYIYAELKDVFLVLGVFAAAWYPIFVGGDYSDPGWEQLKQTSILRWEKGNFLQLTMKNYQPRHPDWQKSGKPLHHFEKKNKCSHGVTTCDSFTFSFINCMAEDFIVNLELVMDVFFLLNIGSPGGLVIRPRPLVRGYLLSRKSI